MACPPEIVTADHVHERIIDTMQHEYIPHVSPHKQKGITVTTESSAPIRGHSKARQGKCAQPKW